MCSSLKPSYKVSERKRDKKREREKKREIRTVFCHCRRRCHHSIRRTEPNANANAWNDKIYDNGRKMFILCAAQMEYFDEMNGVIAEHNVIYTRRHENCVQKK